MLQLHVDAAAVLAWMAFSLTGQCCPHERMKSRTSPSTTAATVVDGGVVAVVAVVADVVADIVFVSQRLTLQIS